MDDKVYSSTHTSSSTSTHRQKRLTKTKPPQTLALQDHAGLFHQVATAQRRSKRMQRDIRLWHDIHLHGPQNDQERRFYSQHEVEDGLLWRRHQHGATLVTPTRYLTRVIQQSHDVPEAAHPGQAETLREVRRRYHHRQLATKVNEHVQNCLICAAVKTNRRQKHAPLKPRTPKYPFEVLSIDTLGPYETTSDGNRYVIVVEDLFTKWVEAVATPDTEATRVVNFLENTIFTRYGSSKTIISDNGTVFMSNAYAKLCRKYNITAYHTPIEHQRANCVERRVQELKKTLRTLLFNRPNKQWDKKLDSALRILRSRKNAATGTTPAKALLGYELPKAGDWKVPQYTKEREEGYQTRKNRRRVVRQHQRQFNSRHYVRDAIPPQTFQVGDRVMARETRPQHGAFLPPWSGPHEIVEKHSAETYSIVRNGRQLMFHVDKLRPAPTGNPDVADLENTESDDPRSDSSDADTPPESGSSDSHDEEVIPEPRRRGEPPGIPTLDGTSNKNPAKSSLRSKGKGKGTQERAPPNPARPPAQKPKATLGPSTSHKRHVGRERRSVPSTSQERDVLNTPLTREPETANDGDHVGGDMPPRGLKRNAGPPPHQFHTHTDTDTLHTKKGNSSSTNFFSVVDLPGPSQTRPITNYTILPTDHVLPPCHDSPSQRRITPGNEQSDPPQTPSGLHAPREVSTPWVRRRGRLVRTIVREPDDPSVESV